MLPKEMLSWNPATAISSSLSRTAGEVRRGSSTLGFAAARRDRLDLVDAIPYSKRTLFALTGSTGVVNDSDTFVGHHDAHDAISMQAVR